MKSLLNRKIIFSFLCILQATLLFLEFASAKDAVVMKMTQRDANGKATHVSIEFVNGELEKLLKFLSQNTDLTIIVSEKDIKGKKFTLTYEENTNSLIVVASEANIMVIEKLAQMLDAEQFLQPEIKVFYIKHGSAENIVRELEDLISGSRVSRRMPIWERQMWAERTWEARMRMKEICRS